MRRPIASSFRCSLGNVFLSSFFHISKVCVVFFVRLPCVPKLSLSNVRAADSQRACKGEHQSAVWKLEKPQVLHLMSYCFWLILVRYGFQCYSVSYAVVILRFPQEDYKCCPSPPQQLIGEYSFALTLSTCVQEMKNHLERLHQYWFQW